MCILRSFLALWHYIEWMSYIQTCEAMMIDGELFIRCGDMKKQGHCVTTDASQSRFIRRWNLNQLKTLP